MVLHQVSLIFGQPLDQAGLQSDVPPVQASGGQDQYYIRSSVPELRCTLLVEHLVTKSNTMLGKLDIWSAFRPG